MSGRGSDVSLHFVLYDRVIRAAWVDGRNGLDKAYFELLKSTIRYRHDWRNAGGGSPSGDADGTSHSG